MFQKKEFYFYVPEIPAVARWQKDLPKKMLSKDLKIFSTGLEPKNVHPMAIKIMQEIGVDISHQKSKNISEIPIDKISIVVTLCGDAAENCLFFQVKLKGFIGQ